MQLPDAEIPGAPSLHQPVPRDPVDGMTLEDYARAAGRLSRRESRADVLAGLGLDERRWLAIEKTWLLRLAVAALREELTLIEEHDRAFAGA